MRKAIIIAMTALLAACSSDKATGSSDTVVGTYALKTVAGINVPATIFQDASGKSEVLSGTLMVKSDKTWSAAINVRTTVGTLVSNEVLEGGGPYTLTGNSLALHDTMNSSDLAATWTGKTITASGDFGTGASVPVVFQK
jgi:hypothetical protein